MTRLSLVFSCCATALMAVVPSIASAAIAIANSGFAGNYVTLYDNDTDTSYQVWPNSTGTRLGSIAYDKEQDDVYFTTASGVFERLYRDAAPTDPANSLQWWDFGGGISDTFAFRGLDVASGSRVAFAWANTNASSRDRPARVELFDTSTGGRTLLFNGSDTNTDLRDVAVDSMSNWVYVSDSYQDRIFRAKTDGTTVETVLSGLGNPGAIDVVGNSLYWTEEQYVNNAWTGSIWRSDLTGGGATSLITVDYRINDIAVGDGQIYWTHADLAPVNYRALSGGPIETLGGNAAWGNLVTLAEAPSTIPEPSTYVVFTGLILCFGLTGWWRRRRAI